jgi:hypothetical protein
MLMEIIMTLITPIIIIIIIIVNETRRYKHKPGTIAASRAQK